MLHLDRKSENNISSIRDILNSISDTIHSWFKKGEKKWLKSKLFRS